MSARSKNVGIPFFNFKYIIFKIEKIYFHKISPFIHPDYEFAKKSS